MRRSFFILSIILLSVGVISLASCSGHRQESSQDTIIAIDTTTSTDTTTTLPKDSVTAKADTLPDPPERLDYVPQDVIALFEQEGHRDEYMSGVIAEIAKSSPSYARRLVNSSHSRFIVVDKGRMKVILYNRYGHEIVSYGMACARNYGTKRGKADCRTPEGFFSVGSTTGPIGSLPTTMEEHRRRRDSSALALSVFPSPLPPRSASMALALPVR